MNIDSHYIIGDKHKICQDYALHGETEHFVYGFLCDGCSGAKNTDFGARLVAHAAKNNLDSLEKIFETKNFWDMFLINIFTRLENSQFIVSELEENLSSTLLCVLHHKKKNITQYGIFGDGNIVVKYKSGHIERTTIEFENSAPFYPFYSFFKNNRGEFLSGEYKRKQESFFSNLKCESVPEQDLNFSDKNQTHFYSGCLDYEWIALTSDGIESFSDEKSIISIQKMLDFKNFSGKFVERRLEKFEKTQKKENLSHFDDLSLVVFNNKQ